MYHDRPCANPTPAHNKHPLHDGNGFSHSLHLGSNRTGKRKQSPHLYAARRCGRKRSSRPLLLLVTQLQLRLAHKPASSPSCRSAAVNQICQVSQLVRQSHHDSCRPRGPQKEKIGSVHVLEVSLITAEVGTPPCPSNKSQDWPAPQPLPTYTVTCPGSAASIRGPAATLWPQPLSCPLLMWMCRLPDHVLWLALACCPVVKVNLLHFKVTHHAFCF